MNRGKHLGAIILIIVMSLLFVMGVDSVGALTGYATHVDEFASIDTPFTTFSPGDIVQFTVLARLDDEGVLSYDVFDPVSGDLLHHRQEHFLPGLHEVNRSLPLRETMKPGVYTLKVRKENKTVAQTTFAVTKPTLSSLGRTQTVYASKIAVFVESILLAGALFTVLVLIRRKMLHMRSHYLLRKASKKGPKKKKRKAVTAKRRNRDDLHFFETIDSQGGQPDKQVSQAMRKLK